MKKVKRILGGFWKLYAMLVLSLTLILLYPIYAIFLSKKDWYKHAYKLLQLHTLIILTLVGVFVHIKGREHLKNIKSCVITPNHSSYLDILVLYQVIPNYFVFMGKQTLTTIPVFNIFFKDMNITVNRKSGISGKIALERCEQELKNGNSVALFPEGTISDDVPNLLPFKVGAFKLAIENQAPIVPITFLTNYKRLQLGATFKSMGGPGFAEVIIHEPISTIGMTQEDLVTLKTQVFETIENELKNNGNR